MLRLLFVCWFLSTAPAWGQMWFAPKSVSFGGSLAIPTAGGLNSPQFSEADLDGDGQKEWVLFDRTHAEWRVFSRRANAWVPNPELATVLPPCTNWALMRDLDGDGKMDVFTDNRGSISVYRQVTGPTGAPNFDLAYRELMSTSFAGNPLPIYVTSTDIPGIVDVDRDGDLDVVTFESSGSIVELHRNVTAAGSAVNFQKTTCWGRFSESAVACDVYALGLSCRAGVDEDTIPYNPQAPQHAGSTILPMDADGDGDLDAVIGDVICSHVNLLTNGAPTGSPPVMTGHTIGWPNGGRIARMELFPAAYGVDVDVDGVQDLVFALNIYGPATGEVPNMRQSIWSYRNQAPAGAAPDYQFSTDGLLQKDMVDWGSEATPVWIDLDNDGDEDLVLGTADRPQSATRLAAGLVWYRREAGGFVLADTNLGGYLNRQGRYCTPFAADLNGDGRRDLGLILPGAGGVAKAIYIPSTGIVGASGTTLNVARQDTLRFTFFAGDAPAFVDMNQDGDLDMLLARDDGSLCLVENTGTPQNPLWGTLQRGFLGYPAGIRFACKVAVADVDGNNLPDVLVTTGTTPPRLYKDPLFVMGYTSTPDTLLFQNNLLSRGNLLPKSFWTAPSFTDLTGDGKPDLTLGTGGGGITVWENQVGIPLSGQKVLRQPLGSLLQNPSQALGLVLPVATTVTVTDALGRTVYHSLQSCGRHPAVYIAPVGGVYLVKLSANGRHQTLRWVAH